jgi:hypothetical protein
VKIAIEPTRQIVEVDGCECRVWKGTTDDGTPCSVFVAVIATDHPDPAEFERSCIEQAVTSDVWFPNLRRVKA